MRQAGSHPAYSRTGTARPLIIPVYDEVPISVIKNNLKTTGLSRDVYLRLLESA